MTAFIDLHMHTNFSDGVCTPEELLENVRRSGVVAFSVTDHDTLDGYRAIRALLSANDPELLPGVELSVSMESDDVHMLAYFFDPDSSEFNEALENFRQKRNHRGRMIVEKLQGIGLDIPFEAVEETAGGSVIGRPHIAETLQRLKAVGGYQEAFDRYIKKDGPAYVPKAFFEPSEAIEMVHRAGGITVLAHPMIDNMLRHLERLVEMGLDGIEVRHSNHSAGDVTRLGKIAGRYGLLQSGGSDFHGREGRHGVVGSQHVPVAYLESMKEHLSKIRGRL
ncbi:MAG: PHP domain-containing protein [candidate division Zixibacteria bacterium]|nr:PHP domain-containing protein [candidate division Zixibacteria bacterium]